MLPTSMIGRVRPTAPNIMISPFGTPDTSPRPAMPRKQKRVIVTSCDTCRLRKLKCNAKELPKGNPCSNCTKHSIPCTFEDSKEHNRPLIKKNAARRGADGSSPLGNKSGLKPRSNGYEHNWTVQGSLHHDPDETVSFYENAFPGHPGYIPAVPPPGLALRSSPSKGAHASPFLRSPPQPPYQSEVGPFHRPGLANHGRSYSSASSESFHPYKRRSATEDFFPGFLASSDQPGPWSAWSLPSKFTDPGTGKSFPLGSFQAVKLLVNRFYTEPTFNSIIVPYEELFGRLEATLAMDTSGYSGNGWAPLPDYLLQVVVACGAAHPSTREPELRLWKQHGWQAAMESTNARANSHGANEVELIQALLLLGIGWMGEPESLDRIIIFEKAFKLAFNLQLQSNQHFNSPQITQAEKSKRICLYWTIYVLDKLVAIACNRPSLIPKGMYNIPMVTLEDLQTQGCSNLTSQASSPQVAQNQMYWLHNLALCYISLAEILEDVQRDLYPLMQLSYGMTIDDVFSRIRPNEQRLEDWCKNHRDLLQSSSEQGQLCQDVTEAIVAQLHLVQLQLYQPPLRIEFEQSEALRKRVAANGFGLNHSSNTELAAAPIAFSSSSNKALTACIESAWHLVQQPVSPSYDPSTPFSSAVQAATSQSSSTARMGATSFAVLKTTQFIRFLSFSWKEWNAGLGMLQYTPRSVPEEGGDDTNFRGKMEDFTQQSSVVVVSQPAGTGDCTKNGQRPATSYEVTATIKSNGAAHSGGLLRSSFSEGRLGQLRPSDPLMDDGTASLSGHPAGNRKRAPPPLNFAGNSFTNVGAGLQTSKSLSPDALNRFGGRGTQVQQLISAETSLHGRSASIDFSQLASQTPSGTIFQDIPIITDDLRTFDFSLTPARTLFDSSMADASSSGMQDVFSGKSANGAASSKFFNTVLSNNSRLTSGSQDACSSVPTASNATGETFEWPGAANAMMTPLKSSFLAGKLDGFGGDNAAAAQLNQDEEHVTTPIVSAADTSASWGISVEELKRPDSSGSDTSVSTSDGRSEQLAQLSTPGSPTGSNFFFLRSQTLSESPTKIKEEEHVMLELNLDESRPLLAFCSDSMTGDSVGSASSFSWTDGTLTSQSSVRTGLGTDSEEPLLAAQQAHLKEAFGSYELRKEGTGFKPEYKSSSIEAGMNFGGGFKASSTFVVVDQPSPRSTAQAA